MILQKVDPKSVLPPHEWKKVASEIKKQEALKKGRVAAAEKRKEKALAKKLEKAKKFLEEHGIK